ncbi:MAG: pantoate--beta-alanine ligase, partial [Sphingomonadales bacterium]
RRAILTGGEVKMILADSKKAILDAGFANVDYFTLVDATTLVEIDMVIQQPLRLLAAAKIGKTRLIDNLAVG